MMIMTDFISGYKGYILHLTLITIANSYSASPKPMSRAMDDELFTKLYDNLTSKNRIHKVHKDIYLHFLILFSNNLYDIMMINNMRKTNALRTEFHTGTLKK